jgi:carbon monoxide dehydrogenase subunit G
VKIEDNFRVEVPIEEAWKVLLDLERIAPCLPGAQLTEVEGDEYRGTVKIKVGPITAQYKGVAKITEADEANHKVVLQAEGRDTRGQGNASAAVVATLVEDGAGTVVKIDTDLNITGKVAQFGRGVMADVSSKLLGQFADNLKKDVLTGTPSESPAPQAADGPAEAGTTPTDGGARKQGTASPVDAGFASTGVAEAGPRKIESKEAAPIDLMDAAGGSVGKRVIPLLAGLAAVLALRSIFKRRKKKRQVRHHGS